ncbi:hypothetical protein QUF64_02610 [Anaerolineales bacterium HSG6]|nr:hypothetical protein [Anaerolineales bacterium HSG6]
MPRIKRHRKKKKRAKTRHSEPSVTVIYKDGSRKEFYAEDEDEDEDTISLSYEITDEPIHYPEYERLPEHVKDTIDRLYIQLQKRPEKVIPKLLDLLEEYPHIPTLYNHLSLAYSVLGQYEKMKEIIYENYRRNPDYLFARLNYAELYLRQGEYDKIFELFDRKYDLKLLYPKRNKFHISEVTGFMGIMGICFFETGKRDTAEIYYDILRQIAPSYPMTKILRQKLHPSLLIRFRSWLSMKMK